MTMDPVIASVLNEYRDFTLSAEEEEQEPHDPFAGHCELARAFRRWCLELLERYVRGVTDVTRLTQAKVLLVDRYFEFTARAAKGHRHKTSGNGHICLYQVFMDTLTETLMVQLILSPPAPVKPRSEGMDTPVVQMKPAMLLGTVSR